MPRRRVRRDRGSTVTSLALRPPPRRIRRRPQPRRQRHRLAIADELVSVAGVVGSPVYDGAGARVGTLDDLLLRSDAADPHPAICGVVIRAGRRRTFVADTGVERVLRNALHLRAPLDEAAREPPEGSIGLAHDVLDRQVVDVDGADVARVSDLVLACPPDGVRLVGIDVSARTLLRRLGPASLRREIAPGRVYDWASVAVVAGDSSLHLTSAARRLRERGPEDLEALFADLPPTERSQLAAHIGAR